MKSVGCSPIYYEPSTHHVPLMQRQGQFNVGGAANLLLQRGEVQMSHAITKHLALMSNFMIFEPHLNYGSSDIRSSRMFDIGLGLFHNTSNNIAIEVYGLAGRGTFDNRLTGLYGNTDYMSGDITKYAVQMNIGLRKKEMIWSYSLRPTLLSFDNIRGQLFINGHDQKSLLTSLNNKAFLEQALTVRFIYDHVKLQFQIGRGGQRFTNKNSTAKSYLSIGLYLNLKKM